MKLNFKNKKVFIIAEAGVNHNGKLKNALALVDVAVNAKADAIKFQTFLPGELTGNYTPKVKYMRETKYKRSLLTKKLALSFEHFKIIKNYCDKKKIIFLSTPDGEKSLDFLINKIKVPMIKIASTEITNHEYLSIISKKNLPVILSTGMSTMKEVKKAFQILKKNLKKPIYVMQCTTEYPAPITEMNVRCVRTLQKKLKCNVGLSDHSNSFESSIAAIAIGAKLIEKHFTLNKNSKGPDHKASLSPSELKKFILALRRTEQCLGSMEKKPTKSELKNISGVRRGIVAATAIKKGTVLKNYMITSKRPFKGIQPFEKKKVIGRILKRNLKFDQPIKWQYLK